MNITLTYTGPYAAAFHAAAISSTSRRRATIRDPRAYGLQDLRECERRLEVSNRRLREHRHVTSKSPGGSTDSC